MRSLVFKQVLIAGLSFLLLAVLIVVGYVESMRRIPDAKPRIVVSADSAKCVDCHEQPSNARTVVEQWRNSMHARKGVGCLECHNANESDVDAFEHYTYTIATVVSPKDCSRCHVDEFEQFQSSHHAKAGQIIGSLDNLLAEVAKVRRPDADNRVLMRFYGGRLGVSFRILSESPNGTKIPIGESNG